MTIDAIFFIEGSHYTIRDVLSGERLSTEAEAASMIGDGKTVRFIISEEDIALRIGDYFVVSDEPLGLMPFVFYHANDRNLYTGIRENSSRSIHLRRVAVDDDNAWVRPLRM